MELEGVIRADADIHAHAEKVGKGIALIGEKEGIVAEWRHGHTDLLEVVEVLQRGHLAEENAMRDGLGGKKGRGKVIRVACLTGMWAQDKRVCAVSVKGPCCSYRCVTH